jgi:copper transport protein
MSASIVRWLRAAVPGAAALAALVAASMTTAAAPGAALWHIRLLSSVPAADAVIEKAPERFELRFSGPVNDALSAISVVYPSDDSAQLAVTIHAQDESILVAATPRLESGEHLVRWRTVSSDGHPVDGQFRFVAAGDAVYDGDEADGQRDAVAAAPDEAPDATPDAQSGGDAVRQADDGDPPPPLGMALLAGLGLACLIGFAGLLWYAGASPLLLEPPVRRSTTWLGWGAFLLLGMGLDLWLFSVRPPGTGMAGVLAALGSRTGLVGAARVLLILAALVALPRRGRLAAVLSLAALLAGAAAGHPAAISPLTALPANAIHLGAVAIWLGGLLLLVLAPDAPSDGSDAWRFEAVAGAVSAAALLAVILIFGSGVLQSFLFVGDLSAYTGTAYGRIIIVKWAGLATLIGFGAYHRFRIMPALSADAEEPAGAGALRRTVRIETTVMLLVIMVAAYLAMASPPAGH